MLGEKIHVVTVVCFSFFKVINTHFAHSGYMMPIYLKVSLPFQTDQGFHDYHHFKNQGNYGSAVLLWD